MDAQTALTLKIIGAYVGYYVAAYLVTGITGTLFVTSLYLWVQRTFAPHERNVTRNWLALLVGVVERILFATSVLIGKPEFVGVWIVMKVVGQWNSTRGKGVAAEFMVAQIGTALSILAGVGSGYLMLAVLPPIPTLPKLPLPR